MGLIRKSLYLGTGGLIAPHSKKQRVQMQQLAALQCATPEEIRRRGGRSDYDGFLGLQPASVVARERQQRQAKWASGTRDLAAEYRALYLPGSPEYEARIAAEQAPLPQEAVVRLSCGHAFQTNDPQVVSWLTSLDGDISYHCLTCGVERHVDDVIGAASQPESSTTPEHRLAEVTRLHDVGVLTDEEYAAKRAEIIEEL